jgi:F-box and leucine-rich repeat protein 10/11
VPRGSVVTKKRSFDQEGSPSQQIKKQKSSPKEPIFQPYQQIQLPAAAQMQGQGLLKPQPISKTQPRPKPSPSANRQHVQPQLQPHPPPPLEPEQPQIDPNLFSMYTNHDEHVGYEDVRSSYPIPEQPQPHGLAPPGQYQLPSLEQIANEVLVDLNGDDGREQDLKAQLLEFNRMANGVPHGVPTGEINGEVKPDDSVDSAVSLPPSEALEHSGTTANDSPGDEQQVINDPLSNGGPAHPSIEATESANDGSIIVAKTPPTKVPELPLYQPPAPLSTSPEVTKQQPILTNGVGGSPESIEGSPSLKRKRGSLSATPGSVKKARIDGEVGEVANPPAEEEKQSLELAKMLQAEELGLRRREK